MTNTETSRNAKWTRGPSATDAIMRWTVLAVFASFVALAVLGQTRPATPNQKRTQPETTTPEKFHSTIAIIVDAPQEVKSKISVDLASAFAAINDTDVYVFSGKFERPPNWTISASVDVVGDKNDEHFVMGIAFSRSEGLVDPQALMQAMENKVEIPTSLVSQLLQQGHRSVSNFKALWIAQGSMKTDFQGAAKRAASLFDHNLLSKDRDAFARRPRSRKASPKVPPGMPFPH